MFTIFKPLCLNLTIFSIFLFRVVDASTMATSLETVKSWRDKRSINVDYVLGCAESHTA